jgi:hypothetical protein
MTRDGAAAARMAHNHEVPGSSPGPATREKALAHARAFSLVLRFRFEPKRFGR